MNREVFKFSIALSLITSLALVPNSQAAEILNTACPTVGKSTVKSGIKYLCVKSGKKYLWQKAPLTKTPTPSQSSTTQPLFSENDKKLEAIYESIKVKITSANPTYEIQVNVDPILNKSVWAQDSINSIKSATKLMRALEVPQTQPMKIYISWGDGYKNQYLPTYCQNSILGGGCGQTGIMFANLKVATNWGYNGVEAPYKSEMDKLTIQANLPHEVSHYAQTEIQLFAGNKDFWMFNPAWLREGGAEYFKLLSYAYDNKVSYKYLHDLYARNSGLERCSKFTLIKVSAHDSQADGCEYGIGLFAAEYLVIKTGRIDSIFAMGKAAGSDTATIFKNAFGFSLADFTTEADKYVASVVASVK